MVGVGGASLKNDAFTILGLLLGSHSEYSL